MDLKNKIEILSDKYFNEIVKIRHYLHQNPELSFEEYNTSKYIASKLKEYGIPFKGGFVKTGIVAYIKGIDPSKSTIALRADIDALPIEEKNDVPYKSLNIGKMHACGHDVHTASLLGAAKILSELKSQFSGTIVLLFQPGEEKIPGGAINMIKEGALENPKPEKILALHTLPSLDAGKVGIKKGIYMASGDEVYINVTGKGGHAALQDQIIDTVFIASRIIVELKNSINDPNNDSMPTIISLGKVTANGATNVVPDKVYIEGTFRTFNEELRFETHKKIIEISESIAENMGGSCEVNIKKGYPVLVNEENTAAAVKKYLIAYLGKENVIDLGKKMTAEDFAYYSQICPGTLFRLGVRNQSKNINSSLHTASFDIDENTLKTGMGTMAWLAISFLNEKHKELL